MLHFAYLILSVAINATLTIVHDLKIDLILSKNRYAIIQMINIHGIHPISVTLSSFLRKCQENHKGSQNLSVKDQQTTNTTAITLVIIVTLRQLYPGKELNFFGQC